jgi:regulator of sigma E protease
MVNQPLLWSSSHISQQQGKTIPATVLRDQKTENITLNVSKDGKLGVQPGLSLESLRETGLL